MSSKNVWLRCKVREELSDKQLRVEVCLHDGTPTDIAVQPVLVDGYDGKRMDGFVKVELYGESLRDDKIAVKLPSGSLNHGHYITVKKSDISDTAKMQPQSVNKSAEMPKK